MAEITTDNPLNISQLGNESGLSLRIVGPEEDGTYKVKSDCTEKQLQAAIDAHIPDDAWTPPAREPTLEEVKRDSKIEALKTKLGITDEELELLRG